MDWWNRYIFRRSPQKREVDLGDLKEQIKNATSQASINAGNSLVEVKGDDALLVTAYRRALEVLAGSVARLPFQFLEKQGGVYVDNEHSPFHYLLSVQPQARMNAFDWKFRMIWQAMHDGDAYVWPRWIDGECTELVLISRGACDYYDYDDTYYIHDIYNGVYGNFSSKEVVHIFFNTLDGRHGIPLWRLGARALSIAATGDRETLERFAKGGNVRGLVSNTQDVDGNLLGQYGGQQLEDVAEDLNRKFGVEGKRIASIGGDTKFTQFSMSSTDMQFLDSRKFAVLEIARLAGVPPLYLYDLGGSNYKMPEQADVAFLTQTLDRMLSAEESEFNRKLVARKFCHKRMFQFDRQKIQAMDMTSYALYLQRMQQMGAYTINEIRKILNLPPVEGGDVPYTSTNTAPLGSEKFVGSGAGSQSEEKDEGSKEDSHPANEPAPAGSKRRGGSKPHA